MAGPRTEHVNSLPRSKLGLRDSIHILVLVADGEMPGLSERRIWTQMICAREVAIHREKSRFGAVVTHWPLRARRAVGTYCRCLVTGGRDTR